MPPLTLFLSEDTTKLLYNKFVVVIGDSIQRGIYKDLVALLQGNEYLSAKDLKAKGELSFMKDELLEGGRHGKMTNGINYREVRQYRTDFHLVRFYFVTRAFNKYWEEVILPDLKGDPVPDVVIINSCLWDISRYKRRDSMVSYKENLEKLFSSLNSILPLETLILWNTALPVAAKIKGGFLLPELEYMSDRIRLDVLEANYYANKLARYYDIDILDLHFYFKHQMHRQVGDGTHWNYVAHRRITNLILAHIAVAWGVGCPRGWTSPAPRRDQPPSNASNPSLYFDFEKTSSPLQISQKPLITGKESPNPVSRPRYATNQDLKEGVMVEAQQEGLGKSCQEGSNQSFELSDANAMRSFVRKMKDDSVTSDSDISLPPSDDGAEKLEAKNMMTTNLPSSAVSRDAQRRQSPAENMQPSSKPSGCVAGSKEEKDGSKEASPEIHPLIGGGLPGNIKLAPIDVGDFQKQSPSPPQGDSHPTSLKSRVIKSGSRYQPYGATNTDTHFKTPLVPSTRPQTHLPSHSYSPSLPLTNNHPHAYSPYPSYPFRGYSNYNPQPAPYWQNPSQSMYQNAYNTAYQPYQANNPYHSAHTGVNQDQAARIRQRIAAERNTDMANQLIQEGFFRLQ
ncbi:uncharacterized protein [Diadema setosum]